MSTTRTSRTSFSIVAVAAMVAFALATPASASPIFALNQWYSAQFGTGVPSAVFSPPIVDATDGPLPGGGTQASIDAPTAADGTWSVTLAGNGYLVVTDLEESGDQFQVNVNGVAASLTTNNLSPAGQTGLAGGFTSTPNVGADGSAGEDIGIALGDANYSSGTFFLPAGTDTIVITYEGVVGNGDMAFFASAIPEPSSLSLVTLVAIVGLAVAFKRRRARAL